MCYILVMYSLMLQHIQRIFIFPLCIFNSDCKLCSSLSCVFLILWDQWLSKSHSSYNKRQRCQNISQLGKDISRPVFITSTDISLAKASHTAKSRSKKKEAIIIPWLIRLSRSSLSNYLLVQILLGIGIFILKCYNIDYFS